ncbi:MAG: Fe-S cluster protein [Candidatus Aureabacteria bacterium]|nr:Fe-S cluster protein [Candidatus Auribacterota bacterium]
MHGENNIAQSLPGLDCGLCGSKTCGEFARILVTRPDEIKRCIHLSQDKVAATKPAVASGDHSCATCSFTPVGAQGEWKDSLGRDYDFILDTFPGEPGPRETIIPHNPLITREMEIAKGDILIGRPLGISCGCPITHCGVVMDVDRKNGVMVWCVTGPLGPRRQAHKDIGYYSAEAYEGLVSTARGELKIGMRYFFLPRRCMLQWRHSGLINFINKTTKGISVRIEGLWIG